MLAFLKLIRLPNLLVIAFTQFMVREFLIAPILQARGMESQLSNFHFYLIVCATVMIAAAGYAINDYFDVRIDKVNKPERLVVGKGVKRRVAMVAHSTINVIAVLIAFYVSHAIGVWKLGIIYFMCAVGLWFYSTTFKREMLIGNIIIALFTALVPIVVGIVEWIPLWSVYFPLNFPFLFDQYWQSIMVLAFFAFITTLLREIIKDIEDLEGDKEYGCKTMPIVIGVGPSKTVTIIIAILTMACLAFIQSIFWKMKDLNSFTYFLVALQLPFAILIYSIYNAEDKKQFRFAGNLAKFIMLLGVCYLFLFSFKLLYL